jgi:hypothetical protein
MRSRSQLSSETVQLEQLDVRDLGRRLGDALDARRAARADGYPRSVRPAPGGVGGHSDPTASAATSNVGGVDADAGTWATDPEWIELAEGAEAYWSDVVYASRALVNTLDRMAEKQGAKTYECLEPDCHDQASRGGRCEACSRWRSRHPEHTGPIPADLLKARHLGKTYKGVRW